LNEHEFNDIKKYLNWLLIACDSIKKFFKSSIKKDIPIDTGVKIFKTSSYKFCNFKESCNSHKYRNKICDKNHFVFDMIYYDIENLIRTLDIIGLNNFNWLLSNKYLLVTFNEELLNIQQINEINNNIELEPNQLYFEKISIPKSFDVISFVLNKMYDEANYLLSNGINSLLIDI
jgi:hypothetical protein